MKRISTKKELFEAVKYGFPIPSPSSNETDREFISRCMGELKIDYPDQKQRLAICYSKIEKK